MRLDYVSLLQQATLPCVNLSSLANPATVLTCDRFGANFKHRDSVAWTLLIRASARAVSLVHACGEFKFPPTIPVLYCIYCIA